MQEFNIILKDLFNRGIEMVLKAELNEHLGHQSHEENSDSKNRNNRSKKTANLSLGDSALNSPRGRISTISPIFVPKYKQMICGIECVVIGLYAKGMNTRDIEDQKKDV